MSISIPDDLAARAKRLAYQRKIRRAADKRLKADRVEAVQSGEALAVSPSEVATLLGLSPDTIYRWVNTGRLTAVKIGAGKRGGRLLIHRDQLDRLLMGGLPKLKPGPKGKAGA
jgi:excisionase family DNA binding protein